MPKGVLDNLSQIGETGLMQLRSDIRTLEILLASLARRGGDPLRVLRARDDLVEDIARLQSEGLDLRAERTRIETVDNMLMAKAGVMARALQGLSPAAEARRQERPPDERWWWHLDSIWAERLRKRIIRYSIIAAVTVLLVVGFDYVMTRLSGQSPTEREAQSHISAGEQQMYAGNITEAIAEYEQAAALMPEALDPPVMLGALYELQGDAARGLESKRRAATLAPDEPTYWLKLAQAYAIVGRSEDALALANGAIQQKPELAQAYLIRGGIYEAQNKVNEAVADFEKCAELAGAQDQEALYVVARTRLGMLMQQGSPGFSPPGMGR